MAALSNMVYSLLYRRPAHVNSAGTSVYDEKRKSVDEDTLASEGSSYIPFGIPDALSFDKIIGGGTCPVSKASCSWHTES